jgi:hypothetical protein
MNISLLPYLLGGSAKYTTDAQFVSTIIDKFVCMAKLAAWAYLFYKLNRWVCDRVLV